MFNKEKFKKPKSAFFQLFVIIFEKRVGGNKKRSWWIGQDSNLGPSGYEPDALTN